MSDYECPRCNGGFPTPTTKQVELNNAKKGTSGVDACPWCGLIFGRYNND